MVEVIAEFYGIDILTDLNQWPGCVGTLRGLEAGHGQIPANLFQKNDEMIALFRPITDAYFAARGLDVPESVLLPLVVVGKDEASDTQE
jgi:hypothetical protein